MTNDQSQPTHTEATKTEATNTASQTALTAAAARAAHLIVDAEPVIFADTLATVLLGDRAEELINYHRLHSSHLVLASARAQVTCRSRYTEQSVAAAAERGVDQYVILGAGLDSFACRSALATRVAVFEVDHPATQQWKRDRLRQAGLALPPNARFVPVDFERPKARGARGVVPPQASPETDSLTSKLIAVGFDPGRPALVSWLGVTMYLTQDAIGAVLGELAECAPDTELILDYMLPAELRDETATSYVQQVAPFAAERGEPWLSFFTPEQVTTLLESLGFADIKHITQRDIGGPALWRRTDALRPASLSMLAHARLAHVGLALSG